MALLLILCSCEKADWEGHLNLAHGRPGWATRVNCVTSLYLLILTDDTDSEKFFMSITSVDHDKSDEDHVT